MKFLKKFVQVESLAIERAIELKKEVGRTNHYLSRSWVIAEFCEPEIHRGYYNPTEHVSRLYQIEFCDPKTHIIALAILVKYTKRVMGNYRWELTSETVWLHQPNEEKQLIKREYKIQNIRA